MNTTSASRVDETPAVQAGSRRILVWDAPVRVFHWLIVVCFAGAYLTSESERWQLLHISFGYTMAGLVAFRVLWGLIGTRYARFSDFVRGPREALAYLGAMLRGRPRHYTGHNPAGALAIVALLGLAAVVTAAGWATYNDIAGHWLEEVHEAAANALLMLVGVHVAAVLLSSWLHHENLIAAMISGHKTGTPKDGIRSAWRSVAALMLTAVLGFWYLMWHTAPSTSSLADRPAISASHGDHRHDDD